MKKSELKEIIKEEIRKILTENVMSKDEFIDTLTKGNKVKYTNNKLKPGFRGDNYKQYYQLDGFFRYDEYSKEGQKIYQVEDRAGGDGNKVKYYKNFDLAYKTYLSLINKSDTADNKLANEALAGHMGAVAAASRNIKSPSGEEPSSSPDEFSLNILVNPLYKKYANYNYKLKDVEFEKPKVKEGFFSDMFSSSPTIKFIFTKVDDGKEASIQVKLKGDKFVLNNSSTSGAVVATMPNGEQAKKFISYLLGQSQWKDELTKTFQNISSALTADSFK